MKQGRNTKNIKLSTKIVLLSGAILLVLNLLLAIIMSVLTGTGINRKQNAFLQQVTDNAQHQMTDFIDKYTVLTEMLAENPQIQSAILASNPAQPYSSQPNYQTLTTLLFDTTEKYNDIMDMGVGVINEGLIYTKDGKILDDIESLPVYDVVNEKRTIVTQPFVNEVTQTLNVSICAPIASANGDTAGFVTVNIGLDDLSAFSTALAFDETGSVTLLSKDNVVMGYSNPQLIGQTFTDIEMSDNLRQELDTPSGNTMKYTISGQERNGIVTQIPDYGWKLIVGMSTEEYGAQANSTVLWLLFLLVLSTVILALCLRLLIVKKLRPLSEVNHALREMSKGNLQVSIAHRSNDEIGQMADSMRSCLETLSMYVTEIASVMNRLEKGDLTVSSNVQFKGDFIPIQHSIFGFVEELNYLMQSITQASEQVSAGSQHVAYGSQALAQGATEQASSVEELSATITQLSTTVKSNSEMAQNASVNATHVNAQIAESGEKMNQSLELMQQIRTSAAKVSGIIKTIEDIAFQTNILALNAAVEAARAGQSGKGFAVVADEVRNLAEKSAEASKATTTLISSMVASIEHGSESMQETKQYMDNVVAAASEITAVFQKISEASERQSTAITQVTQSTGQISSVVQTNSATAEQSAAASEQLSSQAENLKNLTRRFRIEPQSETFGQEQESESEF
nr:methyl-accepting chemotaxis protein [uncultured Butyricicoccus sp.]